MRNNNTFLFFAFLWTVAITILSLITIDHMGKQIEIPYKDKVIHFVFYFVFVLLWFPVRKTAADKKKVAFLIFLTAVGYGMLMELFQGMFTTTRTADILDVLANSTGAFCGLLFVHYRFLNKRKI